MWLHVPASTLSRSALAGEDSTSGSDSLCQELASSATWRTKSLKPASWRTALKRESWATPLSRDWKGVTLNEQRDKSSLPGQVTLMDGGRGSNAGRVLNPAFVEMLMGWPSGLTDYESSETALCRWLLHMRSSLSLLGWRTDP